MDPAESYVGSYPSDNHSTHGDPPSSVDLEQLKRERDAERKAQQAEQQRLLGKAERKAKLLKNIRSEKSSVKTAEQPDESSQEPFPEESEPIVVEDVEEEEDDDEEEGEGEDKDTYFSVPASSQFTPSHISSLSGSNPPPKSKAEKLRNLASSAYTPTFTKHKPQKSQQQRSTSRTEREDSKDSSKVHISSVPTFRSGSRDKTKPRSSSRDTNGSGSSTFEKQRDSSLRSAFNNNLRQRPNKKSPPLQTKSSKMTESDDDSETLRSLSTMDTRTFRRLRDNRKASSSGGGGGGGGRSDDFPPPHASSSNGVHKRSTKASKKSVRDGHKSSDTEVTSNKHRDHDRSGHRSSSNGGKDTTTSRRRYGNSSSGASESRSGATSGGSGAASRFSSYGSNSTESYATSGNASTASSSGGDGGGGHSVANRRYRGRSRSPDRDSTTTSSLRYRFGSAGRHSSRTKSGRSGRSGRGGGRGIASYLFCCCPDVSRIFHLANVRNILFGIVGIYGLASLGVIELNVDSKDSPVKGGLHTVENVNNFLRGQMMEMVMDHRTLEQHQQNQNKEEYFAPPDVGDSNDWGVDAEKAERERKERESRLAALDELEDSGDEEGDNGYGGGTTKKKNYEYAPASEGGGSGIKEYGADGSEVGGGGGDDEDDALGGDNDDLPQLEEQKLLYGSNGEEIRQNQWVGDSDVPGLPPGYNGPKEGGDLQQQGYGSSGGDDGMDSQYGVKPGNMYGENSQYGDDGQGGGDGMNSQYGVKPGNMYGENSQYGDDGQGGGGMYDDHDQRKHLFGGHKHGQHLGGGMYGSQMKQQIEGSQQQQFGSQQFGGMDIPSNVHPDEIIGGRMGQGQGGEYGSGGAFGQNEGSGYGSGGIAQQDGSLQYGSDKYGRDPMQGNTGSFGEGLSQQEGSMLGGGNLNPNDANLDELLQQQEMLKQQQFQNNGGQLRGSQLADADILGQLLQKQKEEHQEKLDQVQQQLGEIQGQEQQQQQQQPQDDGRGPLRGSQLADADVLSQLLGQKQREPMGGSQNSRGFGDDQLGQTDSFNSQGEQQEQQLPEGNGENSAQQDEQSQLELQQRLDQMQQQGQQVFELQMQQLQQREADRGDVPEQLPEATDQEGEQTLYNDDQMAQFEQKLLQPSSEGEAQLSPEQQQAVNDLGENPENSPGYVDQRDALRSQLKQLNDLEAQRREQEVLLNQLEDGGGEQAVEAQPEEEQPVEAQPEEEQAVEAQLVEEQTVEAQPLEEQTVEAQPLEEQTVEGQIIEQQIVDGQIVEEQTVEAQPEEVQPEGAQTEEEQREELQTEGEDAVSEGGEQQEKPPVETSQDIMQQIISKQGSSNPEELFQLMMQQQAPQHVNLPEAVGENPPEETVETQEGGAETQEGGGEPVVLNLDPSKIDLGSSDPLNTDSRNLQPEAPMNMFSEEEKALMAKMNDQKDLPDEMKALMAKMIETATRR